MKNLTFLFFTFSILFIGFTACSDNNNDEDRTPIERIEATSEIDLTKYKGLACSVNGEKYDYALENNKVIITPKKDGQTAYVYHSKDSDISGLGAIYVTLRKPDLTLGSKIDQSTFNKMILFDEFTVYTEGEHLPSTITGLTTLHNTNMLSFTIKNLPQNTIVTVKDKQTTIHPYLNDTDTYQCIYYSPYYFAISIKVDDNEYLTKYIKDVIMPKNRTNIANPLYTSNLIKFEIVYNADAEKDEDKLVIQNGTIEPWVNQHFADK